MGRIEGSTVLVTGGASGLGYLTAERLLAAGAGKVLIWDIAEESLAAAISELAATGRHVVGARVDMGDARDIQRAAREMRAASVDVDILINNAGIVVGREFAEHTHDDISRTMAINALGPMHLTRQVLPGMLARGRGHVVNIASAAGLVANPRMSVYCASKWAVIGWSESLRLEMERGRTRVSVTTVAPYYTDTGMFEGVRSPVIPVLKPEYVANRIVRAIRADTVFLPLPRVVGLVPFMRGVLPRRWFDRIGGDWLGIYRSMSTFRGRG